MIMSPQTFVFRSGKNLTVLTHVDFPSPDRILLEHQTNSSQSATSEGEWFTSVLLELDGRYPDVPIWVLWFVDGKVVTATVFKRAVASFEVDGDTQQFWKLDEAGERTGPPCPLVAATVNQTDVRSGSLKK